MKKKRILIYKKTPSMHTVELEFSVPQLHWCLPKPLCGKIEQRKLELWTCPWHDILWTFCSLKGCLNLDPGIQLIIIWENQECKQGEELLLKSHILSTGPSKRKGSLYILHHIIQPGNWFTPLLRDRDAVLLGNVHYLLENWAYNTKLLRK